MLHYKQRMPSAVVCSYVETPISYVFHMYFIENAEPEKSC